MTATAHTTPIRVSIERGQTRTFAVTLDWPGWCRSGRDEASALQALVVYTPRYKQVLEGTGLTFPVLTDVSALTVVERVTGNATTDFGAPNIALSQDTEPVGEAELERWNTILRACWSAFDRAVEAASGQTLRKGPRGGGRDLAKIVGHICDVNKSYLSSLGGKVKLDQGLELAKALKPIREAVLAALAASVHGEIPTQGPRGGLRWTPRYFVRRLAWHELDHTWEIEDRVE